MEYEQDKNTSTRAVRVSVVNLVVNIIVFIGKLTAGIISHSTALVSDAIHSASDVLDTIIVMVGVKLAAKKPDRQHPFGYERMEAVAALVLAVILMITGIAIGREAAEDIFTGGYRDSESPGLLALIMAICCICIKEAMYWYTRAAGKALSSGALMATAWHSRADALSSLGALAGIIGARMGLAILDPLAGLGICIFVCKVAWDIFRGSVSKLTDKSAGEDVEEKIISLCEDRPEVRRVTSLKTRLFGNRVMVQAELAIDPALSLNECLALRKTLTDSLCEALPQIKDCVIEFCTDAG